MTKNELRYQETELSLMDAFAAAISLRPLDRITVTGLAEDAGISKAAFYRHYRDVQDLAEAFVADYALDQVERMDYLADFNGDEQAFCKRFLADIRDDEMAFSLVENGLERVYLDELTDNLIERLDNEGLLPSVKAQRGAESEEEDAPRSEMAARFVLQGLVTLGMRYRDYPQTLAEIAGALLAALHV
ncbi:MAG: TetR/AcrR family transcriptional regulator [Eggerthellaceae bacterium]|jgi:AcrR family transcriptional regulator